MSLNIVFKKCANTLDLLPWLIEVILMTWKFIVCVFLLLFFRLWLGRDEFTNVCSITSLRRPCLSGWVCLCVWASPIMSCSNVWTCVFTDVCLSVVRHWLPGRSSLLRTIRWATRLPDPASQTWGNTVATPRTTCPEQEKRVYPTCCCVWSLLCIGVILHPNQSCFFLNYLSNFLERQNIFKIYALW